LWANSWWPKLVAMMSCAPCAIIACMTRCASAVSGTFSASSTLTPAIAPFIASTPSFIARL